MQNNKILIDTLEVRVERSLYALAPNLNYVKVIGAIEVEEKIYTRFKVNPNKFYLESEYIRTTQLEQVINILRIFANELNIDISEIHIYRMDIAADFKKSYDEAFKLWLFVFEALTLERNGSNWYNTNLKTYKPNCIRLKDKGFCIALYDKEDESNGRDIFKSRLEMRYSQIKNSDIYGTFSKYETDIRNIDQNIKDVEHLIVCKLTKLYNDGEYKSLSEFVRVNEAYISTRDILKKLYYNIGFKGNFDNWLKGYRKIHDIKFITLSEVKAVKKGMLQGLRLYKGIVKKGYK